MATNSYGLSYPLTDDQVDVPAHIKNLADSVGPYTNMRFANASARDSLLSSPVEGMSCWLADINAETIYTGSQWITIWPVPALPAIAEAHDGSGRTVTATSWAAIPAGTASCSITNPGPYTLECDVYYGAWMIVTASDLRICPVASGGVTLGAGPGGICLDWGQILLSSAAASTPGTAYGHFSIPAGVGAVTVALQAYRTAASGSQTVNYATVQVVPRRWS
jgi:hypothetical protein